MKEIKVVEIVQQEGTHYKKIVVQVDQDFKEWFCKSQGLKRFSKNRFQKVFLKSISDAMPTALRSVRKVDILTDKDS